MGFLSPFMLWGAAAASIPIALHFFFRSRYRTVPWAAMKFLLESIEQTSRRLKFQELLLLILRATLLVLLALALARPVERSELGGAAKGPVDAVFLFDTSASMSAWDGETNGVKKSRMDRAQAAALKILDQLPDKSTIQIVTCADRADVDAVGDGVSAPSVLGLLGPRLPENFDQARAIIKDLRPTSLGTDLKDGINLANVALARAKEGNRDSNREFYIFSDMQKTGWEQHPSDIRNYLSEMNESKIPVTLVHCGLREWWEPKSEKSDALKRRAVHSPITNAAITQVKPQTQIPRPGERVDFAVEVYHTSGKAPINNLTLTLMVDGDQLVGGETRFARLARARASDDGKTVSELLKTGDSKQLEVLKPGEKQVVTMQGVLDTVGPHVVTVMIGNDDFPADDRFDYVVNVPTQVQVLLVDGGKNNPNGNDQEQPLASSFYFQHALVPRSEETYALDYLQISRRRASEVQESDLNQKQLCILLNVAMPSEENRFNEMALKHDTLVRLERFVRDGGCLLICVGDEVNARDYNKVLGDKYHLLPMQLQPERSEFDKQPLFIDRSTFSLPEFAKLKNSPQYVWFYLTQVKRAFGVKEPMRKPDEKRDEFVDVLARFSNGWPLALSRKVGAGGVIFLTTAAEPGIVYHQGKDKEEKDKVEEFTWHNWPMRGANDQGPGATYSPFMRGLVTHLLSGRMQQFNYTAGDTLSWTTSEKPIKGFTLQFPDPGGEKKKSEVSARLKELGEPTKDQVTGRSVVKANDLYYAGIYRIKPEWDAKKDKDKDKAKGKDSTPLAVTLQQQESKNLDSFNDESIDKFLNLTPALRHLLAGTEQVERTGSAREEKEWTLWLLILLLILVLCECLLAYVCSRSW